MKKLNAFNPIIIAPDGQTVCYCAKVTKGQILEAIKNGATDFEAIKKITGACPKKHDCEHNNPSGHCCSSEIIALLNTQNNTAS